MSAKSAAAYHPYPPSVRVFETLEQGSEEWLYHRAGIVTASVIGQLITTKTIKPASNDYSRALIDTLASERITGRVEYTYPSRDMQRGTMLEPYARDIYSDHFGPVQEVGFMRLDTDTFTLGFSPDGLCEGGGLIEIKSPRAKNHVRTLINGEVPQQYMAQCQAGLLVSGRQWLDFVSYCPGSPLFIKRIYPDQRWFDAIKEAAANAESAIKALVGDYEAAASGLVTTEWVDPFADIEMSF